MPRIDLVVIFYGKYYIGKINWKFDNPWHYSKASKKVSIGKTQGFLSKINNKLHRDYYRSEKLCENQAKNPKPRLIIDSNLCMYFPILV